MLNPQVFCPLCKKEFLLSGIFGHLSKMHNMNKGKFQDQFPELFDLYENRNQSTYEPSKEVIEEHIVPVEIEPDLAPEISVDIGAADLHLGLLETLTPIERAYFKNRYDELFDEVDQDKIQQPLLMALVLDEIRLTNLTKKRREIENWNEKSRGDKAAKSTEFIDTASKQVMESILKYTNSLGLSREKKLKAKTASRTTPSSLISGYMDEIARMTPEQLSTLRAEEARVLAEMKTRVDKILARAPDIAEDKLFSREQDPDDTTRFDMDRIIQETDLPF